MFPSSLPCGVKQLDLKEAVQVWTASGWSTMADWLDGYFSTASGILLYL